MAAQATQAMCACIVLREYQLLCRMVSSSTTTLWSVVLLHLLPLIVYTTHIAHTQTPGLKTQHVRKLLVGSSQCRRRHLLGTRWHGIRRTNTNARVGCMNAWMHGTRTHTPKPFAQSLVNIHFLWDGVVFVYKLVYRPRTLVLLTHGFSMKKKHRHKPHSAAYIPFVDCSCVSSVSRGARCRSWTSSCDRNCSRVLTNMSPACFSATTK